MFVAASGAVPCPGAAAVLVFGIGNGAPGLAALSVAAMSLGMGVLLSLLVVATVLFRGVILRSGTQSGSVERAAGSRVGTTLELIVEMLGAFVIIGFGVLMLLPS